MSPKIEKVSEQQNDNEWFRERKWDAKEKEGGFRGWGSPLFGDSDQLGHVRRHNLELGRDGHEVVRQKHRHDLPHLPDPPHTGHIRRSIPKID